MPSTVGVLSGGSLKNSTEPAALGYRVNYVKNPSFEVDISGCVPLSGSTLARTTSESYIGGASLSVTNLGQSGVQFGSTGTGNMIPLIESGAYYLSVYIKLASGNVTANYGLQQIQYQTESGGAFVSLTTVAVQALSYTGNWVRLSGTFTKATSGNYVIFRITNSSSVPGEIFYVDAALLEKSTTLRPYFDGSTSAGFWTGAAHNSFSGGDPYS